MRAPDSPTSATAAPSTRYRIDSQGRVIEVDEGFRRFAHENGAADLSARVLGAPLWSFLDGAEVRQVYEALLARVRDGVIVEFGFRCDSPEVRRHMRLRVGPGTAGEVEFAATVVRIEPLAVPVPVAAGTGDSGDGEFVKLCAWCRRVRLDDWLEPDEAVRSGRIFEGDEVPRVSHGICPDCRERVERTELGPRGG